VQTPARPYQRRLKAASSFPRKGEVFYMVKAYVLVVTDPGATKRVYDALTKVPGVTEVHEVMGPYDIIVEIEVANLVDVPPILSTAIRSIPGIQSTTSLVSFPDGHE
jgi:DNA-binding Lrp family transcriptional regulator